MTPNQATAKLHTYLGKPRTELPWLRGRISMLDCAAAVSWAVGLNPEIISCHVLQAHLAHKGLWQTSGIPQPGDIVIFDWTGKQRHTGNYDHTGLILKADKNGVEYISADSTRPTPGLVSINKLPYKWIAGHATPETYKK